MRASAAYADHRDEELVRLLGHGDADALEALSDRHARPAYSLALRVLGDPGWAEEVVQDVLLRLWKKPELYDPGRGDLRRWLLSVTRNAAIDGLRGRRGTANARDGGAAPLDFLSDGADDPSDVAWRNMQAETVRAALQDLPDAQREVVELAYFGGLSQSEIAQRTGEPLGTVKTRMRLGLGKLKRSLQRVFVVEQ